MYVAHQRRKKTAPSAL